MRLRILLLLFISTPSWSYAQTCVDLFTRVSAERASKWSREMVIDLLQTLHARGVPVNANAIKRDPTGAVAQLLAERKIEGTAYQLFKAIQGRFERWDEALLAARLNPEGIRLQGRWTQENVISTLQALHAVGLPINSRSLIIDPHGTLEKFLIDNNMPGTSPGSLYTTAQKLFGTWENALRSAGFDPAKIRVSAPYWTKEKVISVIQAWNEAGLPLNVTSVVKYRSEEASRLLEESQVGGQSPAGMLSSASRLFGSWDQALRAAGIDPALVRMKAPSWKQEEILQAIRDLQAMGVELNSRNISLDADGRIKAYLAGRNMTGSPAALLLAASAKFGSWDQALKQAGLNPLLVRKYAPAWTNETLLTAIKSLHQAGLQLNSTYVKGDPFGDISRHLIEVTMTGGSSGQLVQAARRLFGSWDQALIAAGINPDTVRLHGTTPYHLLTAWMKQERESGMGWLSETSVYQRTRDGEGSREVVDESTNVEYAMIERENQKVFEKVVGTLEMGEKELLSKIIEIIETEGLPSVRSRAELPQALAALVNPQAKSEDLTALSQRISQIFDNLAGNAELREALLGG